MRTLIFMLLFIFSGVSYAGCRQVANITTETLLIDISDGGCASEIRIFFATKNYKNEDFTNSKEVPFSSECTLIKDGFKCHKNGKTPLAGATYKKIMFGRSQHDGSCGAEGGPSYSEPGEKYICIKGCSKPTVPEFLYGDDGTC